MLILFLCFFFISFEYIYSLYTLPIFIKANLCINVIVELNFVVKPVLRGMLLCSLLFKRITMKKEGGHARVGDGNLLFGMYNTVRFFPNFLLNSNRIIC